LSKTLFTAFNFLDGLLADWLPDSVRVCLWGCLAGALAMLVYLLLSNQEHIAELKAETRNLRASMLKGDTDHREIMRLNKLNLLASLRLLRSVLLPSLLSAAPVLLIAFWLYSFFSFQLPTDGKPISVHSVPPTPGLSFAPAERFANSGEGVAYLPAGNDTMVSINLDGQPVYQGNPESGPSDVVYKRQWWSVLLGNPAGYLSADAPVEEIHWDFPHRQIIGGLPDLLTTWEFPYFFSMLIMALALKFGLKID